VTAMGRRRGEADGELRTPQSRSTLLLVHNGSLQRVQHGGAQIGSAFRYRPVIYTGWSCGEEVCLLNPLSTTLGMKFVHLPGGGFEMGSDLDEHTVTLASERPKHRVELSDFCIAAFQVSQEQYQEVMDGNPSHFKGRNRPVEMVSWHDAQEFVRRLNALDHGYQELEDSFLHTYALPTEAQWEYACRAGTTSPLSCGWSLSSNDANFRGTCPFPEYGPLGVYRKCTTRVGSFRANHFNLYDMHGNVFEWCLDDFHANYIGAPSDGSAWEATNTSCSEKVCRGGGWDSTGLNCRSSSRRYETAVSRKNNIGFRCVINIKHLRPKIDPPGRCLVPLD